MASTGDVELCAVTVIKFSVNVGKSPAEMMKLIKSLETMKPCSVSAVYKWHEDSGMEENQLRTNRGMVRPTL